MSHILGFNPFYLTSIYVHRSMNGCQQDSELCGSEQRIRRRGKSFISVSGIVYLFAQVGCIYALPLAEQPRDWPTRRLMPATIAGRDPGESLGARGFRRPYGLPNQDLHYFTHS